MALYSRNHDYAFINIPGNAAGPVMELLIDLERRFQGAAGAPAPGTPVPGVGAYFHHNAEPAMLRRADTPCLVLWANPLLRLVRGWQFMRANKHPFTLDDAGRELSLLAFVDKLAATPDAQRPDSVRSQCHAAGPWRAHLHEIGVLEQSEHYLRRCVFNVFGLKVETAKMLGGFAKLNFEGCADQITLDLAAMVHALYREDFAVLEAARRAA